MPKVKDEEWLSPKEIGARLGVDEDTVLRWWHQGLPTGVDVPHEYMRPRGFGFYLFHPALLDFIAAEQEKRFGGVARAS